MSRVWRLCLCWFSPFLAAQAATNQVVELRAPADQSDAYFGTSMLAMADLTGDGVRELAVGAFGYNGDGAVFVLNGQDWSLVRQIVSSHPAQPGDSSQFGGALAEGPDLNADGIPELIIGATQADRADLSNGGFGQVYLIDPTTGATLQTLSAPRPTRNTRFGSSVAYLSSEGAGGSGRIAIGAIGTPSGSPGIVHLFDVTTGQLLVSFTATDPKSGDWFGASLAAIGDVDGDGRSDLAVGSGDLSGENGSPGAACVVSGETGSLICRLVPPDLPAIVRNRWAVSSIGDVNGDGTPDVLVGVPLASPPGNPALSGRAYLFSGADGRYVRAISSPTPQIRGFFGWTVAGLADVTGDGVSELLISGSGRPAIGSLGEARMHLINGATGQAIQSFYPPVSGQSFGASVAGVFDRAGRLRAVASGAGAAAPFPAPPKAGRGYAFSPSFSFLKASISSVGIRLSLTVPDERSYDLEASSDLITWIALTKLGPAEQLDYQVAKPTQSTGHLFYRTRESNQ